MDGKNYILIYCKSKTVRQSLLKLSSKFEIAIATSYQQAEEKIKRRHFDILLVQIDLNDPYFNYLLNNYELYSKNPSINLVVIGNTNSKQERVCALKSEAKDYMPIPFYIEELELRLCKQCKVHHSEIKHSEQINIDHIRKEIQIFRTKVKLTKLEYNILNYLMKRKGAPCKDDLQSYISYTKGKQVSENSLRVAIKRLEDKLEKQSGMKLIKNRHGIGYYIED